MNNYFESFQCRSRAHCRFCREQGTRGLRYRESVLKNFEGITVVDFECPHGYPWTQGKIERKTTGTGVPPSLDPERAAESKRRFGICKACEKSKEDGAKCEMMGGCCFGKQRSNMNFHCPMGKW